MEFNRLEDEGEPEAHVGVREVIAEELPDALHALYEGGTMQVERLGRMRDVHVVIKEALERLDVGGR